MSASLSKSLLVCSALNITEEGVMTKKQGMVSILGSDTERLTKAIASIIDSSSEDGEEDYEERQKTEARGQIDIWASIQEEKNKNKELNEKPCQFDIWSSIISLQAEEESSKSVPVPPPYIHPLVKRSASSLSEKSLEICTESLGSETGSDGFSSYPPSETGDMQEDHKGEDEELHQQKQERVAQLTSFDHGEEPSIVKYNYDAGKKYTHRSFPPPIPSLSRKDGASLRMKTHRVNGRLVLQAVSVPSQNNFLAQRQDGRLVLTFSNTTPSTEAESEVNEVMNVEEENIEVEELEEEFESFGEEENESEINIDEGVEDRCSEMEQAPKLSIGTMNVHRLAVIMNKPVWLANRNATWPKNFDEIVKFGEERKNKVEPTIQPPLAQSLPPRRVARLIPSPPSMAAVASLNAYEYYWRRPNQPMPEAAILNPLAQQPSPIKDNSSNMQQLILSKNLMAYNNDQQQLLLLIGNEGDYFFPLLKGCKEPRRSLLFWKPNCIATSS